MAISIVITKEIIGESVLYSKEDQLGDRYRVPLYKMTLANESGTVKETGVTRDSIRTITTKRPRSRYGVQGECPPNRDGAPYDAFVRDDGKKGFRLQLFEETILQDEQKYLVRGMGKTKRQYIQIHIGPGYSEGCFLLTDDIQGRNIFQETVESLLREDRKNKVENVETFTVHVERR